jgi:hypothetical protein
VSRRTPLEEAALTPGSVADASDHIAVLECLDSHLVNVVTSSEEAKRSEDMDRVSTGTGGGVGALGRRVEGMGKGGNGVMLWHVRACHTTECHGIE